MPGISLHAATRRYLDALYEAKAADGTRRAYGSVVNRLCRKFPTRQFASISTADLSLFLYGPGGIALGKAPGTMTLQRSCLRSLFAYGRSMGWRRDEPQIPVPVIRSGKSRGRIETPPTRLTADQLTLVLHRAPHPMLRGMIAVAVNTALRISDIRKIQLRDLNLAADELSVIIQKTGLIDALPITLDLARELKRYMWWLTEETGTTLRDVDAYLFPGFGRGGGLKAPDPSKCVSYAWANHRLNDLYTSCGMTVEKAECWHTIRRSVARIYFDSLRSDISFDHALRQTAALLGHKHATQTETYLGLDAEKAARDESLRGKRLIVPGGNVVPIRRGA